MAHPHGLVIQNEKITEVALTTLASGAALSLGSAYATIKATFLVKRFIAHLYITGLTDGDSPIAIAMAQGDVTALEAAAALIEGNTAGPSDKTQMLTQDVSFGIMQKTLRSFKTNSTGTDAQLMLSMKMPGKGIPFPEDGGFRTYIFNLGKDLTTGAVVAGLLQYWGVWLRD